MNLAFEICGALALGAWVIFYARKSDWRMAPKRWLRQWLGISKIEGIVTSHSAYSVDSHALKAVMDLNDLEHGAMLKDIATLRAEMDAIRSAPKPITEHRPKSWREFEQLANK